MKRWTAVVPDAVSYSARWLSPSRLAYLFGRGGCSARRRSGDGSPVGEVADLQVALVPVVDAGLVDGDDLDAGAAAVVVESPFRVGRGTSSGHRRENLRAGRVGLRREVLEAVDPDWNPLWPIEWQGSYAALRELLVEQGVLAYVEPGVIVHVRFDPLPLTPCQSRGGRLRSAEVRSAVPLPLRGEGSAMNKFTTLNAATMLARGLDRSPGHRRSRGPRTYWSARCRPLRRPPLN